MLITLISCVHRSTVGLTSPLIDIAPPSPLPKPLLTTFFLRNPPITMAHIPSQLVLSYAFVPEFTVSRHQFFTDHHANFNCCSAACHTPTKRDLTCTLLSSASLSHTHTLKAHRLWRYCFKPLPTTPNDWLKTTFIPLRAIG